MPVKKLLIKNEDVVKAWEIFQKQGFIERGIIRDEIRDSWLRCKEISMDPDTEVPFVKLTNKELKERCNKFKTLLKTTKPFMYSLLKIVGIKGFIARLIDKDGYILEINGDNKLIEISKSLNMYKGANIKEEIIGTNAIGIALKTKKPIQVLGSEHYKNQYKDWTCSACPIKDTNKNLIGILSISAYYKKVHPHTLGMVIASAEAIEKEMKLQQTNRRLRIGNKHYQAIVESISEGLISLDKDGKIEDINLFARRILRYKNNDLKGKDFKVLLHKDSRINILSTLKSGKKYEQEEIYLKNKKEKKVSCIANVTPIIDTNINAVEGLVITFREAKVVHNLVNKIVGAQARFTFDDILGESEAIKETIKLASFSADTDATILLLGESGTGKEMFAQAIHNKSKRKNKPFVFLNCGAIPRELVASELFGYVGGAFTGAKKGGHPGKFELANGGTIFLDEIGDMPLDTQANLLRVLETKEVVRVGGHDVIKIDVRVIAATHKNLKKEVERGNFRRDLYYRLNVMPIYTPSLRTRKNDIKIFIDHFLNKFISKMDKNIKGIENSFYRGMANYNWPGNVRELQNVMQLVINTAKDGDVLSYKHLPTYTKPNNLSEEVGISDKLLSLEEIERIAIEKTLQEVNGNIASASKILEIGRSTLYRKIRKYNIDNVSK